MSESNIFMEDIPTDVQLEIISFLDISSTHALMASKRTLRSVLTCEIGDSIWKLHIQRLFGMEHSQALFPPIPLKDDLQIPCATISVGTPYCSFSGVNLPFLLSRIPENLPSAMIKKNTVRRNDDGVSHIAGQVIETMDCVCAMSANNPLPRPILVLPKSDTVLAKVTTFFSRNSSHWSPFVAPHKTTGGIDVTPRLVSYFEVSIGRKNCVGRQDDAACINGCVAIGLAEESHGCGRSTLPGLDGCSYGYHSDNGGLYHCSGHLLRQAAAFGPGDVIGMGIDYVARGIFVTKNGEFLGFASYKLTLDYLSKTDFYPIVGKNSEGLSVAVNFGNVEQSFRFDLAAYCKRQQQLVSKRKRISRRYQFAKDTSRNRTFCL